MGLIQFGELRTEHLCIFLLFLVYVIFNLFSVLFTSFPDDPFVNIFSMFLGELFCGIFIPITKYLNKSDISHSNNNSSEENNTNNKNINQINKIYATFIFSKEQFKEINPDFNMIIICLISFIDFLNVFMSFYSESNEYALNKEIDFIYILITLFLSFFFLNMKIYKHHKLMITLIIILSLIINYIQYLNKGKQKIEVKNIISSIHLIIYNFLTSFSIVIYKFLMDKNHCSPFKILFFSGIFGILYVLFFSLFYHIFIDDNKRNFYESIFKNVIFQNFFHFLFWNIHYFFLNLLTFLTVKFLQPTNLILVVFSAKPIVKLINFFKSSNSKLIFYDIILYILYIIFIFCCLIFNEFIILNLCGLNYFTKVGICDRGEKETLDMLLPDDENSEVFTN